MADRDNLRNSEIRALKERRRKDRRLESATRILLVVIIVLAVVLVLMVANLFKTRKKSPAPDTSTRSASQTASVSDVTPSPTGSTSEQTVPEVTPKPTEEPEAVVPVVTEAPELLKDPVYTVGGESLYSECAYMMRRLDGYSVLEKFPDAKIYPASMTKLMTALVVVESLGDLNEKLTVTYDTVDKMYTAEASMAGFEGGEDVSVIDLLYGALLPSGAECCDTLAIRVSGSVDAFVEAMNNRAAQLGMTGTHFANTTGLHSDNHYSTCRDMARLMNQVLESGTLRQIMASASHTSGSSAQHPDGLTFNSTLFYNLQGNVLANGAVIMGGKTGTTDEAGKCLASYALYSNDEYILVTAQAWEYGSYGFPNIEDAQTAFGNLHY